MSKTIFFIHTVNGLNYTFDNLCEELIQQKAINLGKKVRVESLLCKGAFSALLKGDKTKHDTIDIVK